MRIGRRRAPGDRVVITFLGVVLLVLATATGCGGLFRQYEYEEDVYLSLDGSATVFVNSSIAALNALHGLSLDAGSATKFDRDPFRQYFSSPNTHVTRVAPSRRNGRRFVHVRMDVDDIRQLGATPPFAWSTYSFARDGNLFVYKQVVGGSGGKNAGDPGWNGHEMVAFRLHLPSKIVYHNTLRGNLRRGNILVWEQPLSDRLKGVPLTIDARMETQSILYRTLWLFGVTFVAVALTFGAVIWWILRRAPSAPAGTP
jgi:hypothetical protein